MGCALVLILAAFAAGRYRGASRDGAAKRVLYYVDSMHPAYRSDKPGRAPDCGMALTPVYEGDDLGAKLQLLPGAMWISSDMQELIGLEVEAVVARTVSRTTRTTGRVIPDENRLFRLIAATDGWIRSMPNSTTGARVRKGDVLARFTNPGVLSTVQSYLVARAALERVRAITQAGSIPDEQLASAESALRTREMQLRALGMGDAQIAELARSGQPTSEVELVSPADGIVVSRNVLPEQPCERGMELYRIADIGTVWIEVPLFDDEQKGIRPGTRAKLHSTYFSDTLYAAVEKVEPFFDSESHTLQLRLHADNPGHLLWPDMDLDVEIRAQGPAGISVLTEAVLDSGPDRIVYVQTSDGVFERRPIETAGTFGDRIMVTRGLKPGEKVVTSGTFLLDSASRMKTPHLQ